VSAAGGTAVPLTTLEAAKHTTHRWPAFLPDGKHFLFFATNHSGGSQQGIYIGSLEDGTYKHVVDADSQAQYASGYLIYHLQSQLQAQKFDPASGTVSGDPVPLANFVEYDAGTWHTSFVANQNGVLIYEPGSKMLGTGLAWLDRTGKILSHVGGQEAYKGSGRISPDGKRLAVSMGDPEADIWIFDLVRGSRTRLTFGGGGSNLAPSWSADGQRVVYVKQAGITLRVGTSLRARIANGGGQEELLMEGDPSTAYGTAHTLLEPQWTPDGRYLLHTEQSGPSPGVWAMPATGDKKPIAVVLPPTPQTRIVQFRLSPDGTWLAYASNESGRDEVYVTHFPDGIGRWQVSQTGGTFPTWRRDSKEIYFIGLDGNFQAATVSAKGSAFEVEQVRALFPIGNFTSPLGVPYDAAPDGQHFVIATLPASTPTPLVLVTNWMADVKK
jgi:hypothetical protein